MPLYNNEIARREPTGLMLRTEPLRLRWTFDDLISGDGHGLRLAFSCSVRALPEAAEKRMLEEVFLNSASALTVEDVAGHFQAALRAAAAVACQKGAAGQWLDGDRKEIVDALKAAANKLAFSSGLELMPPFGVDLDSPTLERQRLESMQRTLAEQRAAGQMEHFQRAADLLRQFEQVRQSAPQLSPGQVLSQLAPGDQGTLLQTLLMAAAEQRHTRAVWVVAGMNLLSILPRVPAALPGVIPVPTDVGPLRSVQRTGTDDSTLLIGARSGVIVIDPEKPTEARAYADPAIVSQLGFSRAVTWHDEIWACHGEAGIVLWKMGQRDQPQRAMRPVDLQGAAPRNLVVLDGRRALFSSRDSLFLLERGVEEQVTTVDVRSIDATGSEIIAILPEPQHVTLALQDGRIQLRDRESLELLREQRPCGAISAAALLPWLGSFRILLATEDGPILCVAWEDELVTQYQSLYHGMKSLAAAADVVAGISADRQRVVLWNTWSGKQPVCDLYVPTLTRHRAADVEA